MQAQPKHARFCQWLKDNGSIFDKVEYPAVFGQGLVGARLLEDLGRNEAFIFVPNRCIMSTEHARKTPLGALFELDEHKNLFVTNTDRDTVILIGYLIYERLKGSESFYQPYLDMVDCPWPTCYWDPELLDEHSDLVEMKANLLDAKKRCDEEWDLLNTTFFSQYHPEHFPT